MKRQADVVMPTKWGNFKMIAFANEKNEPMPHIAMVHENFTKDNIPYVRIHSECMTGDLFGSVRCDCGEQLEAALKMIAAQGGILIYLRQEGRGIGLINKLKAYRLQDKGLNTVDANVHLGFGIDQRDYGIAISMLQNLKANAIHLITNNPLKIAAIETSPIEVISRIPIIIEARKENIGYLKTKENLMGHLFKMNGDLKKK